MFAIGSELAVQFARVPTYANLPLLFHAFLNDKTALLRGISLIYMLLLF